MSARTFEDLAVWQKARELTKLIYQITLDGSWSRDYGLRDQIRLAAVSAMSNIAEGFERQGDMEFGHFLSMAKGSAGEVRSQLYIALDAEYLDDATLAKLLAKVTEVSKMISGLATYLREGRRRTTVRNAAGAEAPF